MAGKAPTSFPVVLEKKLDDGKTRKRNAHSLIAYYQLISEGYKEQSAAPARRPSTQSRSKAADKGAEKGAEKGSDESANKSDDK